MCSPDKHSCTTRRLGHPGPKPDPRTRLPIPADACRQHVGFRRGAAFYDDGAHFAVDWTNASALRAAIAQGPVKIGVAADALTDAAVRRFQQSNGLTVDGIVGPTGPRTDHRRGRCLWGGDMAGAGQRSARRLRNAPTRSVTGCANSSKNPCRPSG
ncbi:peptidoglycan-binding domain-containing protein [Calidifontibacter indicus]|uniref:peptidoglycan-binding domain-containing protein n=1 Tax=Calidifontibacter indicus TaxID=419650 RepID=UPI003CCC6016